MTNESVPAENFIDEPHGSRAAVWVRGAAIAIRQFVNREDGERPASLEHVIRTRVRGTAMTEFRADELRPGDIVDYHGERHVVRRIDRSAGAAWPVASDGTGWAIALGREPVLVLRP